MIFLGLHEEQLLELLDLGGIGRREVGGLGPILGQVEKFPGNVAQRILIHRPGHVPGRADDLRAGDPALVIDRVISHHLEVLRFVRGGALAFAAANV